MKGFFGKFRERYSIAGLALCALAFIAAVAAVAALSPQAAVAFAGVPVVFGMAMGQTSGIEKSVKCTAAVGTAFTIAKPGADDDTFSVAAAATDALIGVFQHTTSAANDEIRVMVSGITKVVYGGTVTRGDELTADANGKAIANTDGDNSTIGIALVSGVSGDIGCMRIVPNRGLAAGISRNSLTNAAKSKCVEVVAGQIAATGNLDVLLIAPETGVLSSADFAGEDALAANDTNYVTFSVTNKGQDGSGSTAMLAATDPNTTKATGGSAIAALGKRALTLHGTAANLDVTTGDVLLIRAAATGTLANVVDRVAYVLRFGGTT